MTEFLRGIELKKKEATDNVTICWKQGYVVRNRDNRSQTYTIFAYETIQGGKVPVYIQDGYDSPDKMICDEKLQCGMSEGVFFLVYHDKEQKPSQDDFILNDTQKKLYEGNDCLNPVGIPEVLSIMGGYLRDFW